MSGLNEGLQGTGGWRHVVRAYGECNGDEKDYRGNALPESGTDKYKGDDGHHECAKAAGETGNANRYDTCRHFQHNKETGECRCCSDLVPDHSEGSDWLQYNIIVCGDPDDSPDSKCDYENGLPQRCNKGRKHCDSGINLKDFSTEYRLLGTGQCEEEDEQIELIRNVQMPLRKKKNVFGCVNQGGKHRTNSRGFDCPAIAFNPETRECQCCKAKESKDGPGFTMYELLVYPCPHTDERKADCEGQFVCPAGYVCPDSNDPSTMVACGPSYYADQSLSQCVPCDPGSYSVGDANAPEDCLACPANTACLNGVATECPEGQTVVDNQCQVATCPPGQHPIGEACEMCPVMTASATGESCVACDDGFVASHEGSVQCEACFAGSYADAQSHYCELCPTNEYSTDMAIGCTPCEAGMYCASEGSLGEPCPAGNECPTPTTQNRCDADSYSPPPGGLTECLECPNGQLSNDERTECTGCENGNYLQDGTTCTTCPAGSKCPTPDVPEPQRCPSGSFSGPNAVECTTCAKKDAITFGVATSEQDCKACAGGYYLVHTNCTLCEAGYKCPLCEDTQPDCIPFETREACPAEQYTGEGATECEPCPSGCACPEAGSCFQDEATSCNEHTHSLRGFGNARVSFVMECKSGEYSHEGASECSICEPGTVSGPRASNCTGCDPGFYADAEKGECVSCPAGYKCEVSGEGGHVQKIACEAGQTSEAGGTSCTDCPIGTFSEAKGSPLCESCESGSAAPTVGSTSCQVCGQGTYIDELITECTACPPGTYNNETGHSICRMCPPGTFNSLEGSQGIEDCIKCPAGTENPNRGQAEIKKCILCKQGEWAPEAATAHCSPVPAGTYNDVTGVSKFNELTLCPKYTYGPTPGGVSVADCLPCPKGTNSTRLGNNHVDNCSTLTQTISMTLSEDIELAKYSSPFDSYMAKNLHVPILFTLLLIVLLLTWLVGLYFKKTQREHDRAQGGLSDDDDDDHDDGELEAPLDPNDYNEVPGGDDEQNTRQFDSDSDDEDGYDY